MISIHNKLHSFYYMILLSLHRISVLHCILFFRLLLLVLDSIHPAFPSQDQIHEEVGDKIDEFLSLRDRNGQWNGEGDVANAHEMHLLKQLREQGPRPWSPDTYRSLLEWRSDVQWEAFTNSSRSNTCCTSCTIISINSSQEAVKTLKFAMLGTLEQMESTICFRPCRGTWHDLGIRIATWRKSNEVEHRQNVPRQ